MRKSLSLLLAIAMVFSMFSSLAFAADADLTAQQKYDALAAKGIFAGINGEAALDQNMNRAQFARVAALILGLEDVSATDTSVVTEKPFSDVELGLWYTDEIAAAKKAGVFVGNADGTFNPKGDITIQELAVVAAGLLGLEAVADATVEGAAPWAAGYIQALITAKVDFPTNYTEAATRADLASLSFQADAVINPATPVVPATLEVKSVSSSNLKTFAVVFNQPVDKDTVNSDNVKITDVESTVSLSDDGLTAYVIIKSQAQQSDVLEFVVNGVKTKDAKEIKDYKVKVTAIDSTVPVATGATFINHKEIQVQFSEPMNLVKDFYEGHSSIKIDGVSVIAKSTPDNVKNTLTLEFPNLLKNGTLKLEVADIKDYAGYKIAKAEFDVLVVEDKDAPVIASAEVKNLTTVQVTFNERIATTGTFTVNGKAATATTPDGSTDGKKFNLTFTNGTDKLDLGATVEIKVGYKGQKDVAGNEVKDEAFFTFKVTDDTTLPSVTAKVESGNKVVLTFSKAMQTTVGTIRLLDNEKKEKLSFPVSDVSGSFKTNDTVLEIGKDIFTTLDDINGGTFYINLKDMKDSTVRTNLLPEQTLEIAALDTKLPTVTANYSVKNGTKTGTDLGKDDTATFFFSEAVNADTAKNLSNYVWNTVPLNAVTGASFKSISGDARTVVITIPSIRNGGDIDVYAIKDVAGNMIDSSLVAGTPKTRTTQYNAATAQFYVVDAKATAKNKVEVELSSEIGTVDPSAFAIYDTGSTTSIKTQFVSASVSGTTVTFTTASDIGAGAATYDLVVKNVNALTNSFGLTVTANASNTKLELDDVAFANLTDGIKPGVKESKRGTVAGLGGTQDDFVITFDEDLNATPVYRVRDKDNKVLSNTTDYTPVFNSTDNTLTITVITPGYNDVIKVEFEIGGFSDGTNVNDYISITSSDKIKSEI